MLTKKMILFLVERDLWIFFTIFSIVIIVFITKFFIEHITNTTQEKKEEEFWGEIENFLSKNKSEKEGIKWNIKYSTHGCADWLIGINILDIKQVIKNIPKKKFFIIEDKIFQIRMTTKKFYNYEWQKPIEVIVTLNK